MLIQIEKVLTEHIKPKLHLHLGDIEILEFVEGKNQLILRLTGQCSVCPSSVYTIENTIKYHLKTKVEGIGDIIVETGLSDEMVKLAKKYLKSRKS